MSNIQDWELDTSLFLNLLKSLVSEGKYLQNWPSGGYIPEEDRAAEHILKILNPFNSKNGGNLSIEHIHINPKKYPKRGNIILRYPANADVSLPCVSFVGSHLDVVFANEKQCDRNPFEMTIEDDNIYGRGTTDCLGHCALLTNLFLTLAKEQPNLNGLRIIGVIICDEEAGGSKGEDMVGVEGLQEQKYLEDLIHGPLIWLDCADKQPNIGSGGTVQWSLHIKGKMAHSGFPQKAINAIELGNDALLELQNDFYKHFPIHDDEKVYGFESTSSFKATRASLPDGSLNQVPGNYTIEGDIRLIPFYRITDAMNVIKESVKRLNNEEELIKLQGKHGPDSKYVLYNEDGQLIQKGEIELTFLSDPIQGIACSIDSNGYHSLANATKKIIGHVSPLADTGSLPLVADLKDAGFDVQTVGYGVEDAYHADNEFARISDYKEGFKVLCEVIHSLIPK